MSQVSTPEEIKSVALFPELPEGVTMHFVGSTIRFDHKSTSKAANHALHVARRRVVNALISNTEGRKFSGPKRAQRVYLGRSTMYPDGLSLRLNVSETESEHEAHRLGRGGIFKG